MFDKPIFEGYDRATRLFYSRIVFMMMLNQRAVEDNLFDVLLSDTDDIYTWHRFVEAIPELRERMDM